MISLGTWNALFCDTCVKVHKKNSSILSFAESFYRLFREPTQNPILFPRCLVQNDWYDRY